MEAANRVANRVIEAANRVANRVNQDAVGRELLNRALADLCLRLGDRKNHRVDRFGDLLLFGHFPVVPSQSGGQKEV